MEKDQAAHILGSSDRILVTTQAHPNGDQFSSAIGLSRFLQNLGKTSALLFEGTVPPSFSFLPYEPRSHETLLGPRDFRIHLELKEGVITPPLSYERDGKRLTITLSDSAHLAHEAIQAEHSPLPFDVLVVVGCAEKDLVGGAFTQHPEVFTTIPIVNIDQHAENTRFGSVNIVDLTAPSCSEIVYEILSTLSSKNIDGIVATSLLAGVLNATKNFRHPRTTPKTFLRAAALLNHGADREQIAQSLWRTHGIAHLKKTAEILKRLEIVEPGPFGLIMLDEATFPFKEVVVEELTRIGINLLEDVFTTFLALAFVWKTPAGYAMLLLSERRHLLEHVATQFAGILGNHALTIPRMPQHPKDVLARIT